VFANRCEIAAKGLDRVVDIKDVQLQLVTPASYLTTLLPIAPAESMECLLKPNRGITVFLSGQLCLKPPIFIAIPQPDARDPAERRANS
jgi:hypothetical protein